MRHAVAEIWRVDFPPEPGPPHAVLPDVRWGLSVLRLADGSASPLVVTPPHAAIRFVEVIPGGSAAGVIFRPGRGPRFDGRIEGPYTPTTQWPQLAEAFGAYAASPAAGAAVRSALGSLQGDVAPRDPAVAAALVALDADPPAEVGVIAHAVGLSERQLRRRFTAAVGLSPRAYAVTRRLHASLVALARADSPRLAEAAGAAGFADQSHWGRAVQVAYRRSLRTAHAELRAHRARFQDRRTSETF